MAIKVDNAAAGKAARISRELLLFLSRLLLILFSLCIVTAAGIMIPEMIRELGIKWKPLDVQMVYGGPIVGGAIILATLKFLGESFPVLWNYIWHNKREKMLEFYSAFFVAVLGFSIANLSIKEILTEKTRPTVLLNFQTAPTQLAIGNGTGLPVFFLTFPEGATALKEDDAQRALLDDLVQTMTECSKLGDASRQNIEIETFGFASSSGSDGENRKLANQRGKWVKDYLDRAFTTQQLPKQRISVLSHSWQSIAEMRSRRLFMDEKKSANSAARYSEQAAALNRRVEIHLLDVAGCRA